jgi:hypothetical protein
MNPVTPRVDSSTPAALGFRAHSGWTAFVALALDQDEPRVLSRGRPELVRTFTYEFRQPYHTAEKMSIEKARAFVSRVDAEAKHLAQQAIRSIHTDLKKQGYELTHFALIVASAKPLPNFDKILSSHALIHTADGELFREALTHASAQYRLTEFKFKERELVDSACETFGLTAKNLTGRLTALGRQVGPPWSQDEKFAALAAWLALSNRGSSKS